MRRVGKKKLDLVGAAGMRKLPSGSSPGRLRRGPIHVPAWSRLGGACRAAWGAFGVWVTEPGALGGQAIRPAAVYALDVVVLCGVWSGPADRLGRGGWALPQACQMSVVSVSQQVESQMCRSAAAVEARPARAAMRTTSAVPGPESLVEAAKWA